MKKKHILFATCMIGAFTFSSCEKNLYDESKQPEKELQLKDLEIPADFKWDLTQVAQGTTSANIPTMVSFFLDEACSEDKELGNIPVYAETLNLPLSIPTYTKAIYARYESMNGTKTLTVPVNEDGSFSLSITDANVTTTRAITRGNDIEDDINFKGGVVYHPSKDWGTIMFEDQFPSLGDYDFNDFVVNYKVQFQELKGEKKEYKAKAIQIGLRLKAIGGTYPCTPYLRLKEIDSDEVESIEIYDSKNIQPAPTGEVKLINNKHVLIDCSPLMANLQKPTGSKYYNVEKDFLAQTDDLPEIHILIELKERKEIKDILEDDEFDLYLQRDNGIEIHMNGIEPVSYKYPFADNNLYPVYESDGDEEDDNYYLSKDRYIWGLRVPDNISHTVEKANFLKAYQNFAKWAESGGKNNQNWYNQGNVDKDILIHN